MELEELTQKSRMKWDEVTAQLVVDRLLKLMTSHIGRNRSISKDALFTRVYGVTRPTLRTQNAWILQQLLNRAMLYCRKRTNCFISSYFKTGSIQYFVMNTTKDADAYVTRNDAKINGLIKLQARAQKSINEQWYRQEFKRDA